jgi:hypothetical protein
MLKSVSQNFVCFISNLHLHLLTANYLSKFFLRQNKLFFFYLILFYCFFFIFLRLESINVNSLDFCNNHNRFEMNEANKLETNLNAQKNLLNDCDNHEKLEFSRLTLNTTSLLYNFFKLFKTSPPPFSPNLFMNQQHCTYSASNEKVS